MSEERPKPRAGDGDVPVTIDGEEFVLTPNFNAAKLLSARSGGILNMVDRVVKLDVEAVLDVITLGLGYGPARRPPKDLAERIWRTGMTDSTGGLADRCIEYLHILANGGRPLARDPDEEAHQDSANPPTKSPPAG